MESCNYIAIARCKRCGEEMSDDFNRTEPLISVNMYLSRRDCQSCNSTTQIKTTVDYCSFKCFWEDSYDGEIVEAWERYCGDR